MRQFFIVGTGRCGTNLLREMLILHPGLEVVPETHFIPTLYDRYGTSELAFADFRRLVRNHYDSSGHRWIETIVRDELGEITDFWGAFSDYCGSLREATVADFVRVLQRFLYGGGTYQVGDKTPHYGVEARLLRELWPGARFVHVVRDGVHAGLSMVGHPGFRKLISAEVPTDRLDRCTFDGGHARLPDRAVRAEEAVRFWARVVVAVQRELEHLPDEATLRIRYEDLVTRPGATVVEVAEFLGVEGSDAWRRKAEVLPRPFTMWRNERRISQSRYRQLYREAPDTLAGLEYPYRPEPGTGSELLRAARYLPRAAGRRTAEVLGRVTRGLR